MEQSGSYDHFTDSMEYMYGGLVDYWTERMSTENVRNFSSNFACNLTEENPDLAVPWEYELLLESYRQENGSIRTDYRERREAGLMKFVCEACAGGDHSKCVGKSHCDCQHMVSKRTRDQVER